MRPSSTLRRNRPVPSRCRGAVLLLLGIAITGCAHQGGTRASGPTSTRRTAGTEQTLPPDVSPSSGCGRSTDRAPTNPQAITVAGTRRTYLITPPTVAAADDATRVPAPLVLLFHGFAGSARQISALTDLPTKAAAQGMFAVVPDGTSGTWGTPDTPFVEALIDHIERTRCIDVRRVFATGFSAGAAFAISFACGHPSQIAAIAPVAVDLPLGCVRPTSILAFHGTADPMVSYRAGPGGLSLPGADLPGTEADMVAWARLGRCNPTATVTRLGTEVVRKSWTGCAAGTDVALYRIEGGGHAWPGGDPKQSVGPTTRQVDASDQILAFFAGHHQPPDH